MAALSGVRVLDFTWVLAGPFATQILADLGAEVIRIERPDARDDPVRHAGLYADINRNKYSLSIDMSVPTGVELARRLAGISDLVADNFTARVMRQWGMDYERLVLIKPDIICLSLSGFGHTGPLADYLSFGPNIQAMSGFTSTMAQEPGKPAGFGYSYADLVAGFSGALAALFALHHCRRTGRGQFIDLSQFETMVSTIGPSLLDLTANQRSQRPPGWHPQEGAAAPHGIYRCRPRGDDDDRWLVISVRSHSDWRRFVAALGSPLWASDPKFHTLFSRMQHREELDRHIESWSRQIDATEAMALLQAAGVAAGLAANSEDLCDRDPQLKARGFWPEYHQSADRQCRFTGMPFELAGTPNAIRRPEPDFNQDREYILGSVLGLSLAQQQELLAANAIMS